MKQHFKPHWSLRLGLALLVLTLLSSYMVAGLSAKYFVRESVEDSGRTAAFSLDLTNGGDSAIIDLEGVRKPGDSEEYCFNVISSSEVSMRCWIGLTINGSMPLECAVTKDDSEVVAITLDQLAAAVPDDMPLTAASAPILIRPNPAGIPYTLTVTWPAEANDLEYANNSVAELRLQILAEQVD